MIYLLKSKNIYTTRLIWNLFLESIKMSGVKYKIVERSNFKLEKNDYLLTSHLFVAFKYIFLNKKVIFWFQGIVPEESYMRHSSKLRFILLSFFERIVFLRSSIRISVSKQLNDHLNKKYSKGKYLNSYILPCFSDKNIDISSFSKYSDISSFNFLYAGNMQVWQNFEFIVKVYLQIEKKSIKKTKLFVLTPQKEFALSIIKKYNIKSYEIDHMVPGTSHYMLRESHFGFVLRENSIVNNVSTPTKFSTYISNGIIPIFTSNIHPISQALSNYECKIELISSSLNEIGHQISSFCSNGISKSKVFYEFSNIFNTYYSYDKYVEFYSNLFSTI